MDALEIKKSICQVNRIFLKSVVCTLWMSQRRFRDALCVDWDIFVTDYFQGENVHLLETGCYCLYFVVNRTFEFIFFCNIVSTQHYMLLYGKMEKCYDIIAWQASTDDTSSSNTM